MIIGIAGKKGSGKDLVAQIIKYLDVAEFSKITQFDLGRSYSKSKWEIVRFADKLKDIVCILIGCTREQLEDREFKETPLGEEWAQYYLIRTSSDSIFTCMDTKEHIEERCRAFKGKAQVKRQELTPRQLLQLIGTECGRKIIHPNIWVTATMVDYKKLPEWIPSGDSISEEDVSMIRNEEEYPGWIIPDVRFPNEVEAIKDRGGIVIRVEREGLESDAHESETALDDYKGFDFTIHNNGTIEELVGKVNNVLNSFSYDSE